MYRVRIRNKRYNHVSMYTFEHVPVVFIPRKQSYEKNEEITVNKSPLSLFFFLQNSNGVCVECECFSLLHVSYLNSTTN